MRQEPLKIGHNQGIYPISHMHVVFCSFIITQHSAHSSNHHLYSRCSFCLAEMRTIMPRTSSLETPSSSSSSSSMRNFKWVMRRGSGGVGEGGGRQQNEEEEEEMLSSSPVETMNAVAAAKKRSSTAAAAVSRFRSVVMTALIASRQNRSSSMGSRITCTLYGHRHGHVHLAFQVEAKACPVVLLELATPTSNLVREMASGLVRIALECERKASESKGKEPKRLMEEPMWRAYCNGRKCGYAVKRECGPGDWKVLKAVEPVSMGAGVLPKDGDGEGPDGEMMYMRARFERVVGSRDSEAFYMMNPDGNGGTELSIYFLRV